MTQLAHLTREKMLAGELYDACDAELLKDLNAVKVLCQLSVIPAK